MIIKGLTIHEADASSPFHLQIVREGVEEDAAGEWRADIVQGKLIAGGGITQVVIDETLPIRDALTKAHKELALRDADTAEAEAVKARRRAHG